MLRLSVGPSPQLAWLLGGLHGAVLALGLTLPQPWWGRVLLALVLVASALHAMLLHAWQRLPHASVGLEISEACEVTLLERSGAARACRLLPSSFVTPWLTVLNLQVAGTRWPRALVLLPDRVDGELYRRLRVRLRWGCRANMADQQPRL